MSEVELVFELIDATGGGCCRLGADETIEAASPGFLSLAGFEGDPSGQTPHALVPELPALAELPERASADAAMFRHVGADGVGRELTAARAGVHLILIDRSGEARLRRTQTRLGRQIDDLKAELAAREREPRRPRVRSMAELARRLDEAIMRARRYRHPVSIVAIRVEAQASADASLYSTVSDTLVSSVRGVDDLGRVDAQHWVLVLPHTPIAGAEVVGKRVQARLGKLELERVAIGVAQVGDEEAGSAAVERADQACTQALEKGGGLLLAVALV
ncbi:hypothetical protein [Plesiocystis pacifica]|nr:hypothetical protein [Plesiocystis pacifica]